MYTIRYNNLDDLAADNCAMHCQSNIANNVKEYAVMIFNFSVFRRTTYLLFFSKVFISRNNLSKLSAPPEKKKNHYTITISFLLVVDILSVIANSYYSPSSS